MPAASLSLAKRNVGCSWSASRASGADGCLAAGGGGEPGRCGLGGADAGPVAASVGGRAPRPADGRGPAGSGHRRSGHGDRRRRRGALVLGKLNSVPV